MLLGVVMAASKNHGQLLAHTHILLAGSVLSFMYGLCHKLWLNGASSWLAQCQFYIHQIGVLVMCAGLFLLYGNYVEMQKIDPILALSSIAVLLGMVLMTVLFFRATKNT